MEHSSPDGYVTPARDPGQSAPTPQNTIWAEVPDFALHISPFNTDNFTFYTLSQLT